MRTVSRLAAVAAASVIVIGTASGAGASPPEPHGTPLGSALGSVFGSVGPTGSAVGLSRVPGDVSPAENRLVAFGGAPSWTCFGSVTADIDPSYEPGTVLVDWTLHQFGVGTCGLEVTLNWRNLDTGATGAHRLDLDRPGNWPSYGDDQNNTSVTGPGAIEYRLVTNGGGAAGPVVITTP